MTSIWKNLVGLAFGAGLAFSPAAAQSFSHTHSPHAGHPEVYHSHSTTTYQTVGTCCDHVSSCGHSSHQPRTVHYVKSAPSHHHAHSHSSHVKTSHHQKAYKYSGHPELRGGQVTTRHYAQPSHHHGHTTRTVTRHYTTHAKPTHYPTHSGHTRQRYVITPSHQSHADAHKRNVYLHSDRAEPYAHYDRHWKSSFRKKRRYLRH